MYLGEVVFQWKTCFSQLPYECDLSPHLPQESLEGRVFASRHGLVCSVLCAWAREAVAVLVQKEGTYPGRVTVAFCSYSLDRGEALNHYLLAKGNREPLKADVFSHCLREKKVLKLNTEACAMLDCFLSCCKLFVLTPSVTEGQVLCWEDSKVNLPRVPHHPRKRQISLACLTLHTWLQM